jgi:hypothetical protein
MSMHEGAVQVRSWLTRQLPSDVAQSIEQLCGADDVR